MFTVAFPDCRFFSHPFPLSHKTSHPKPILFHNQGSNVQGRLFFSCHAVMLCENKPCKFLKGTLTLWLTKLTESLVGRKRVWHLSRDHHQPKQGYDKVPARLPWCAPSLGLNPFPLTTSFETDAKPRNCAWYYVNQNFCLVELASHVFPATTKKRSFISCVYATSIRVQQPSDCQDESRQSVDDLWLKRFFCV